MMSLQTIRSMSAQQARRSCAEGRGPLVIEPSDCEHTDNLIQRLKGTPYLGDRTPKGWKKVYIHKLPHFGHYHYEELFVDLTGCGYESEPALTRLGLAQMVQNISKLFGVGIGLGFSELGQFQGHIRVMVPTGTKIPYGAK